MVIEFCNNIVKEYGFTVEKRKISFINRFFGADILDNKLEVLLLAHVSKETRKPSIPIVKTASEEMTSAYEVTGSPLEHEFGDEVFNVSTIEIKRNWYKSEEKYQPISLETARDIINQCKDAFTGGKSNSPIFCIVNPKTSESNEVLVGMNVESRGFITATAWVAGITPLSKLQTGLQHLLKQHLQAAMNAKKKTHPRVQVFAIYDICGLDPDVIDIVQKQKGNFSGFLRVETSWQELAFTPPLRKSSSTLKATIISGSKTTPLSPLWDALLLIDKYIKVLEEYQQNNSSSRYSVAPLNFPKDLRNPFLEESSNISEKLNKIFTGDHGLDEIDITEINSVTEANSVENCAIKLADLIKSLVKRQDQDFTDLLWNVVKTTNGYTSMIDCIHMVFEEIELNDFKPSLNANEDTRIGKMVAALNPIKKQLPQLAGSISMELVIDIGLEKLARDYTYLLSTGNLMEIYEISKMFNPVAEGDFDISKYREKLLTLAQIHVSLEFLQLIQTHLNCRIDISRSIFQEALKLYKSPESLLKLENLQNHEIYSLTIPAPKEFVAEAIKKLPASWKCTLTTDTEYQNSTTITHYSRTSIFPPNIYTPEDFPELNQETEEEITYHVTKGLINVYQITFQQNS